MRVIIAGSRTVTDYNLVCTAVIESKFNITEVVSGTAIGVDRLGERWAEENAIHCVKMPADWDRWGKGAGFVRNLAMAEYADALIAITTGSAGAAHMIRIAQRKGLQVYVKKV